MSMKSKWSHLNDKLIFFTSSYAYLLFYNYLEIFSFVSRQNFKYNSICIKESEHTKIKNNISPILR